MSCAFLEEHLQVFGIFYAICLFIWILVLLNISFNSQQIYVFMYWLGLEVSSESLICKEDLRKFPTQICYIDKYATNTPMWGHLSGRTSEFLNFILFLIQMKYLLFSSLSLSTLLTPTTSKLLLSFLSLQHDTHAYPSLVAFLLDWEKSDSIFGFTN